MPIEFLRRTPSTVRLCSLREDVLVESNVEDESLLVTSRWGEFHISDPDPIVNESLRRMSLGPVSLQNVVSTVRPWRSGNAEYSDEAASLERVLTRLSGSVVHSLGLADTHGPLFSADPVIRNPAFTPPSVGSSQPVRLSRFAAIRPSDDGLVLESPLAPYRVVLHQPLLSELIAWFNTPVATAELASDLRIPQPVIAEIVSYLAASGTVLIGDDNARFAEDDDSTLQGWSHHELLFHSRSRMARHDVASGAVYALPAEQPPTVKPVPEGEQLALFRPDQSALAREDTPPVDVPSGNYDPGPAVTQLSAAQLGELLFRAARLHSVVPVHPEMGVSYEISERPYWSSRGVYELELYVSVNECAGLRCGIYHYDPQRHALTLINDSDADLIELLDSAKIAAGSTKRPPALITTTARMVRLFWMFGGNAYAMTLMHAGALQQMLHSTAAAMGLSTSAVARDASDVTDRALRLRWPSEVGVGQCAIGL
ncbi:MAG: SagB/ThcOx family dehydrogenase [Pseudonocardiaceae bacterium]|nr:SagB/ThcOx family dehydrogenase [Pseudonocardiaceae bacterium]